MKNMMAMVFKYITVSFIILLTQHTTAKPILKNTSFYNGHITFSSDNNHHSNLTKRQEVSVQKTSVIDRINAINDKDNNVDDFFFQGDIRVPVQYEDIVLGENSKDKSNNIGTKKMKKNLIYDRDGLWPRYTDNKNNNTYIPYAFARGDKEVTDWTKELVRRAARFLLDFTCIELGERNLDELNERNVAHIYIIKGVGCHATVGKFRNGGELSLGDGCDTEGVIYHELMHLLGFHHEHNRKDRDKYINVDLTKVSPENHKYFKTYFGGRMVPDDNGHPGLPYDMQSIMHYQSDAMGLYPGAVVITDKNGGTAGIGSSTISNMDVDKINMVYYCWEYFDKMRDPRSRDNIYGVMNKIHGIQNEKAPDDREKDYWNSFYSFKDGEPHRFGRK